MRKKIQASLVLVLFFLVSMAFSQEIRNEESKIFINAVIYPTFSLSRYDYNNDLNHAEIRAYVNLRLGSPHGEVISDAEVAVNGNHLEFNPEKNNYEKRIQISSDSLAGEFRLNISTREGVVFTQTYSIPEWLIIQKPQPSIVDSGSDLRLSWSFVNFGGSVDVRAYNFKTGDEILSVDNLMQTETLIPAENLHEDNLLRIYVICSWFYKKYIRGENLAQGSEMNIMPWSQVFIRTK